MFFTGNGSVDRGGSAESNPAARKKLYRKIESFLIENGLLLPLFHEADYRVASPRVWRLTLRSSQPFRQLF